MDYAEQCLAVMNELARLSYGIPILAKLDDAEPPPAPAPQPMPPNQPGQPANPFGQKPAGAQLPPADYSGYGYSPYGGPGSGPQPQPGEAEHRRMLEPDGVVRRPRDEPGEAEHRRTLEPDGIVRRPRSIPQTSGQRYAEPSDRISSTKAKEILSEGTAQGHPLTDAQRGMFGAAAGRSRYAEDVRYASNPTPPAIYSPYPRDSFGRPRGVMDPIPMDEFVHGKFGYSELYDSDDVRRRS